LPAAFPNLLVNGSSGIAVGMSTNIPPHNLGEVIDATVALIKEPDCTVGSDGTRQGAGLPPTGTNIVGRNAVHKAYKTGRGRVRVRAESKVDEQGGRIVISGSLPAEQVPTRQAHRRGRQRVASDCGDPRPRDESDRDGIRVVVELKRDAMAGRQNQLLVATSNAPFGVINLALVGSSPQVLDLKRALEYYVEHRRDVVRRRSNTSLQSEGSRTSSKRAAEGARTGRRRGRDHPELRRPRRREGALEADYGLVRRRPNTSSDQLGSLASMENPDDRVGVRGRDRSDRAVGIYPRRPRRPRSGDHPAGYGRSRTRARRRAPRGEPSSRMSAAQSRTSFRRRLRRRDERRRLHQADVARHVPRPETSAGRIIGTDLKRATASPSVFAANSHDYLLVFTGHGQIYELKTYEIREMVVTTARGKSAVNLIDLDDGGDRGGGEHRRSPTTTIPHDGHPRTGTSRRTAVDQFGNIRSTRIRAIRLEDGDEARRCRGDQRQDGHRYRRVETGWRSGSRVGGARDGPHGPQRDRHRPARAARRRRVAAIDEDRHNWGAHRDRERVREALRSGRLPPAVPQREGYLIDIKTGDRSSGEAVAIEAVTYGDHLLAMSDNGQIMRTRVLDRSRQWAAITKGVIVMNLDPDDTVASVDIVSGASTAARRTSKGRITAGSPIAITSGIGCQRTIHGEVVCSRNAMNRS